MRLKRRGELDFSNFHISHFPGLGRRHQSWDRAFCVAVTPKGVDGKEDHMVRSSAKESS